MKLYADRGYDGDDTRRPLAWLVIESLASGGRQLGPETNTPRQCP